MRNCGLNINLVIWVINVKKNFRFITTSFITRMKRQKFNFINSGPWIWYTVLIISTVPELMKLNFCRFIRLMNDGPYMLLENGSFLHLYFQFFSTTFYTIYISHTCLRSRKSISKPQFDKIYLYTAEMKLLMV